MTELDSRAVREYFSREGTVSRWWTPGTGPLAFHYDAEQQILEEEVAFAAGARVLDVGTGAGRFGAQLAARGCHVTGVDLNPEMLARARARAEGMGVADRFAVRPGDATDLAEYADASFDVVLCMELFDHLPDLSAALSEMRRVLAPGGSFLFTYVPSESLYGVLGNVYRFARARAGAGQSLISRTYRLGEVRRRLAGSGFALDRYWGVGLLCASAQTRLFAGSRLVRALTALARAEARRVPYYRSPRLARHGAHVVGLARPLEGAR